jgi:fatty-acyl-CoA synthase
MTATEFRAHIARQWESSGDKPLLRIVLSSQPNAGAVELCGRDIVQRGRELARAYTQAPRGQVVLLLLPHSVELFLLHLGLVLEGWLPAILAWPTSRVDPEKYQRNLLHQLRNLPAGQLITVPQLSANLGPGLPFPAVACPIENYERHEKGFRIPVSLPAAEDGATRQEPGITPEDALFLQFSGGTTGAQKAVVVTVEMMESQMERLREVLEFGPADAVASWLPLYHDMGLIACVWLPLCYNVPSTQMAANDWLLRPDMLFETLDHQRATWCWLPNFAFSYLAAQRERYQGPYDLQHVRGFVNCSEPVRMGSMQAFVEAFREWGVRPEMCQASYAMAENLFAVTQTPPGQIPATLQRSVLQKDAPPDTGHAFDLLEQTYVSSGRALRDMEIRVVHPNGDPCAEREAGDIQLRTPSLFNGYWGSQGFLRYAISADGWYATGDYGFLDNGELYVIGRLKDIMIIGGQNIFPEDVELVVNSLPDVYTGRVVSFGISDEQIGTEAMTVVAELRGEYAPERARVVERQIQQTVLAAIGIAPRYVAAVPERWIVKSTAGKISRKETRERFQQEKLGMTAPAASPRR